MNQPAIFYVEVRWISYATALMVSAEFCTICRFHAGFIQNSSTIHPRFIAPYFNANVKRPKWLARSVEEYDTREKVIMGRLPYQYLAGFVPPLLVGIAAITQVDLSKTSVPLLGFAGVVSVAGLAGGLTNAYIINHRSLLSEEEAKAAGAEKGAGDKAKAGMSYVGNGVLGAVAACISWLAYGSYSNVDLLTSTGILTGVSLATAFFVGMAGPKWLQSERDKGRWQAAAADAARADPDKNPGLNVTLSKASSDEAPQIARKAASR